MGVPIICLPCFIQSAGEVRQWKQIPAACVNHACNGQQQMLLRISKHLSLRMLVWQNWVRRTGLDVTGLIQSVFSVHLVPYLWAQVMRPIKWDRSECGKWGTSFFNLHRGIQKGKISLFQILTNLKPNVIWQADFITWKCIKTIATVKCWHLQTYTIGCSVQSSVSITEYNVKCCRTD